MLDLLRNFINESEMEKVLVELIEKRGMRFEHLIFVRVIFSDYSIGCKLADSCTSDEL